MIRRKKIINSLGHCLDMLVNSQIKCDEKVVFFALDFFVRQFALQTTATNCLQPSEKYDKMHDYTVCSDSIFEIQKVQCSIVLFMHLGTKVNKK